MKAALCLAALLLLAPAAAGQARPDLQGLWTNLTATPLERPPGFDALTTTEAKAVAFETASPDSFLGAKIDDIGGRQSEWWELGAKMTRIDGQPRTSIIIDPPDGKLPFSEAGRAKLKAAQDANLQLFDDPEGRPSPERCLTGGSGGSGAPIFSPRYNANYFFVQTQDYLVIHGEQNSEVRIIPIGADSKPPAFGRWMGTSHGAWEGNTLVVRTSGFVPGDAFKIAAPIYISPNAHVTERFTRLSPDALLYEYTVEDLDIYTQPWRTQQVFTITASRTFETACHEANYSLPNILKGGRTLDGKKAKKH